MTRVVLYLTVSSWVLLLIGIIIVGVVSHMFGNPWILITVGLVIVAAWSMAVYRIAEALVRKSSGRSH